MNKIKRAISVAFIAAVAFVSCFGFVEAKATSSPTKPAVSKLFWPVSCDDINENNSTTGWTLAWVDSWCYQSSVTYWMNNPPPGQYVTRPWCCIGSTWWYTPNSGEGEATQLKAFQHWDYGTCHPTVAYNTWGFDYGMEHDYSYYTCTSDDW